MDATLNITSKGIDPDSLSLSFTDKWGKPIQYVDDGMGKLYAYHDRQPRHVRGNRQRSGDERNRRRPGLGLRNRRRPIRGAVDRPGNVGAVVR